MCEEKLAKLEQFWLQFLSKELSSENITLKKINEAVQHLKDFFGIANFEHFSTKVGVSKNNPDIFDEIIFILFLFMYMMRSSSARGSSTVVEQSPHYLWIKDSSLAGAALLPRRSA
jgi:hypothetical protein